MYSGVGMGNSLIAGGGGAMPLSITSPQNEHSDIVITHEECIRDIYGCPDTDTEQIVSYNINPGLIQTFPFISKIAQNFEYYVCEQLIFKFESVLSNRVVVSDGTQPQNGMVYGVPLGPSERVPNTVGEIDDHDQARGGTFDARQINWGVEMDPAYKQNPNWKPIRTGGVDGTTKDNDVAKFALAVANTPDVYANKQIGKLKVYARFRLFKIKPLRLFGPMLQCDRFMSAGNVTSATCFGDGYNATAGIPCIAKGNNIGCAVKNAQSYTVTTGALTEWLINSDGSEEPVGTSASSRSVGEENTTGGITSVLSNATESAAPSDGSFILIKFPSNAEGCFEVTVASELAHSDGDAYDYADTTKTTLFCGGKTTPIFDMCVGGGLSDGKLDTKPLQSTYVKRTDTTSTGISGQNNADNAALMTGGPSADATLSMRVRMATYHIRVLPSLQGEENILAIPWSSGNTMSGELAAWKKTELSISEYKIQDNYEIPAYVDVNGNPAEYIDADSGRVQPYKTTTNSELQGNTVEVNPVNGRVTAGTDFLGAP